MQDEDYLKKRFSHVLFLNEWLREGEILKFSNESLRWDGPSNTAMNSVIKSVGLVVYRNI